MSVVTADEQQGPCCNSPDDRMVLPHSVKLIDDIEEINDDYFFMQKKSTALEQSGPENYVVPTKKGYWASSSVTYRKKNKKMRSVN